MAKVFVEGGLDAPALRDRRLAGGEEVIQSQQVRTLRHLSFDAVSSIQFCVDSASGLPISCTSTRVTARLLSHDRSQIGEPSAPSYCDPDSDCYSPKFDLHMGWRGNALQPTITIVCRIDTLERPSLLPKCVGFAVLKLCVDINGNQPGPEARDARVFLNAGHFLLPIVYGRVPSEGDFSEALMDRLPHIHGAYLSVRLFDPSVDSPNSAPQSAANDNGWFAINHGVALTSKCISETAVISILIDAFPYSAENIRKLPISDAIAEDIKKGVEIGDGERKIVIRQLSEWMAAVFPPLKQKIPLIDPRFMLKYEDRIGAFCALDMLYNMPNRPELLRSTQEALGAGRSRGLFATRRFDNRIQYYKAYFRYLPGSNPSGKESIADLIIDDASLELDLSSQELHPVFCDDFSRTVGIDLSPNACLLVVVTAVDMLTSQRMAIQQSLGMQTKPQGRGGTQGTRGSTSEEAKNRRGDEEKAFKLKGLVGVHFGNDDPSSVWWGIVPLLVESPFQKRPKSGATRTTMPVSGSAGGGGGGAMIGGGISSRTAKPLFGPAGEEDKHSLVARLNPWLADDGAGQGEGRVRFDAQTKAAQGPALSYFVNAGTHQVPLFNGFPPEEMIKSASPMAWLLSNLSTPTPLTHNPAFSSWWSGLCQSADSSTHAIATYNHRRGRPMLSLSPGCSAFISLVDPRLRQFSNDSVTRDPGVLIKEEVLNRVLRAKFLKHSIPVKGKNVETRKRDQAYASFHYAYGRVPDLRSYGAAIPSNIFSDALLQEVNAKFIKIISEGD